MTRSTESGLPEKADMQTFKYTSIGSLMFAVVLWTANVIYVAILRIFFGAQGKSTLGADVMIFGAMLGIVFVIGAIVGYAVVNLLFHSLRTGNVSLGGQVRCAVVAALLSYAFLPMGYLSVVAEFIQRTGAARSLGVDVERSLIPWAVIGAMSGLLVFGVTSLSGALRSVWRDRAV